MSRIASPKCTDQTILSRGECVYFVFLYLSPTYFKEGRLYFLRRACISIFQQTYDSCDFPVSFESPTLDPPMSSIVFQMPISRAYALHISTLISGSQGNVKLGMVLSIYISCLSDLQIKV